MINSASYIDDQGLSKLNFYPSHLIDSLDLQNTYIQHVNQQKSYDTDLVRIPHLLSKLSKPTDDSKEFNMFNNQL